MEGTKQVRGDEAIYLWNTRYNLENLEAMEGLQNICQNIPENWAFYTRCHISEVQTFGEDLEVKFTE